MTAPLLTLAETLAVAHLFDRAADCTRWEPGARTMAINTAIRDPRARDIYAMLAAERCLPANFGQRIKRRPAASTVRRKAVAARRRIELRNDERGVRA